MSKTDFGYQQVTYEEKTKKVNQVFDKVSSYYDLMNDLMSLGLHRHWKKKFVSRIDPQCDDIICDLACGSGDISISLLQRQPNITLSLVDPSGEMLKKARVKLARTGALRESSLSQIHFHQLWAESLGDLSSSSFDKVVCSFGFRNMTQKEKALEEIYRVLKPGGQIHILEFSHVDGMMKGAYNFYRDKVLPQIGHFVGDIKSYEYLAQSIDVFWDRKTMEDHLAQVGFQKTTFELFNQGICCYCFAQK